MTSQSPPASSLHLGSFNNTPLNVEIESDDSSVDASSGTISSAETLNQHLVDDGLADSASRPSRPRWSGGSDKFRYHHREERALERSLRDLEANDLSIHLYNAHILKRRLCRPQLIGKDDAPSQRLGKSRWLDPGGWAPHPAWTAWPLRLEDVPLEHESWMTNASRLATKDSELTYRSEARKPSEELQSLLMAEMTRFANASFASNRMQRVRRLSSKVTPPYEDDVLPPQRETPPISLSAEAQNASRRSSLVDNLQDQADQQECNTELSGYPPSLLLDDERIANLLLPSTRRILGDLGRLLLLMRYSRKNHSSKKPQLCQNDKPSSHRVPSRRKLRTRDWSEVIGSAHHAGWDDQVVTSAARRCQTLFGEQMHMESLLEEAAKDDATAKSDAVANSNVAQSFEHSDPAGSFSFPTKNNVGWKCPEASCPEGSSIFTMRSEWLEHIETIHGYQYSGLETIVPFSLGATSSDTLSCPDPDCERHAWPFPQQWRLREHMKRKHAQNLPLGSSTSPRESSDHGMHGAVHVDGFLQPIKGRAQWKVPSRSTSSSRSGSEGSAAPRKRPKHEEKA